MVSSTCFEHPSVHPQEDLYMQFYGIPFMHPYKHIGRWQDVLHNKHSLHIQVFLRMNTWLFETCRRQY